MIGATLGRYIALRFTRAILGMFLTVFALVYILDFVETLRRAGDVAGVSNLTVAHLSLLRTPSIAEQVLPFAILFGSMTALLGLSRKLELVVARAAGFSAWQFLQPGLLVAIAIGVISVIAYNPLAAVLKQQATTMEATLFSSGPAAASGPAIWIRQRSPEGTAIIQARGTLDTGPTFTGISAFVFDQAGRFAERIEAQSGLLREGYWEFSDARVLRIDEEPLTRARYRLASRLDPRQVQNSFTAPEAVPFWNLRQMAEQTERAGLDSARYRLRYEVLIARPLLFVAMVLVAASVSLRFFRFGGVGPLVLGGVAAGFLLYVVTELMEDLGGAGLVSATLAAWFPAVVGSLLGTLSLLHQEDG